MDKGLVVRLTQRRARASVLAASLLAAATWSGQAFAGLGEDAMAATKDIYVNMTAKNTDGFLRYRPADGFTEFTPNSKHLERLDLKPFVDLFKSDKVISLRAEDLSVRVIGQVAIVTGLRIGYVAAPGTRGEEVRYGLTMAWTKEKGQMKLQHLHYSVLK